MIRLSNDKHWDDVGFAPYATDDRVHCVPECVYFSSYMQDGFICFLADKGKFRAEYLDKDGSGQCIRRQECTDLFDNGGQE